MKKTVFIILEIILIFGALLYYTICVMVPEYQKSKGSSDRFIKSSSYQNMIEITIDQNTDFAFLINQEGKIYHMFFFDNSSVVLYNKDIENKSIGDGLAIVFPILIKNQTLHESSSVILYRNNDSYYDEFQNNWEDMLLQYSISIETFEKVKSLEEKAMELNLDSEPVSSLLLEMDFYSKEFVKNYDEGETVLLNQKSSREFADRVYQKIEESVFKKQIKNINKDEVDIDISLIPADQKMKYYPTSNSWYYVKDGKVYAFIEFYHSNHAYSYCYQGSMDTRVEGECKS